MSKLIVFLMSVAVFALASIAALGHHSFALFDLTRQVTIKGVVEKIEWTNPHVFVEADVPQQDGTRLRWGIEFTSINHLTRLGIKHQFESYDGDHGSRIRERFLTKVLPFFSANLAAGN